MEMPPAVRQRKIENVTIVGLVVNILLSVGKILAGVFGFSAAMLADGIHSLSDLLSDIVVLVFVRISAKGRDKDHDYGHGKFETFATLIVSLMLIVVAARMLAAGVESIREIFGGGSVPRPGYLALGASIVSILSKEILYWYTVIVGKKVNSPAVIANAWHHRSDAFSSVGSLAGIAGAMFLGDKWIVLDPAVCCIISIAIFVLAVKMAIPSVKELLDVSLPDEMEQEIIRLAASVDGVRNVHGLKTRRNGTSVIMEAHIVVDPDITVVEAHDISTKVEGAISSRFGRETQITIHIEPSVEAE